MITILERAVDGMLSQIPTLIFLHLPPPLEREPGYRMNILLDMFYILVIAHTKFGIKSLNLTL